MNCTLCKEAKQQIAEILTMLEPILVKLNRLNQQIPDNVDADVNGDTTDSTENVHTEDMVIDDIQKTQQQQQRDDTQSDANGTASSAIDDRRVTSKRRRVNEIFSSFPIFDSNSQPNEQFSTQQSLLDNLVANASVSDTTVNTNLARSLYVSNFTPTVESADIMKYLNGFEELKHITDGIKCTKLVKKNKKWPLTFVSFKLDIPRQHYGMVANPTIWLTKGEKRIIVKEFVDNQRASSSQLTGRNADATSKQSNSNCRNAESNPPKPMPTSSKNSTGTVRNQTNRPNRAQNRQANAHKWQRVQNAPRQNRPNTCQKSCCSQQQQQQQQQQQRPLYHHNCHNDHCVGDRLGYRR